MSSTVADRHRRRGVVLIVLFLLALVLHTLVRSGETIHVGGDAAGAPVVGVAPNVSGTIIAVAVHDNQPVHVGDLLFPIDPQRFDTAVKQAEANLSMPCSVPLEAAAAKVSEASASLTNERAQTQRILMLVRTDDGTRARPTSHASGW